MLTCVEKAPGSDSAKIALCSCFNDALVAHGGAFKDGDLETCQRMVAKRFGKPKISRVPGGRRSAPLATGRLLIFGGDEHKVFLGCLSCDEFDTDSVRNQFGSHGSQFASESILNQFGEYGSAFSTHSACNAMASDPPVVVDDSGQAYGRLTVNSSAQQIDDPKILGWLQGICRH